MGTARARTDERLGDRAHLFFCVAIVALAAAIFYVPALRVTQGDWPAPLDDVFIHFDFARSAARGHPFEWIAGQGFASGETAPLYPLVLAIGHAAGFHGTALGVWAAVVACFCLVVLMRSLRQLVSPASAWVSWAGSVLVVSVGVLDWSFFSGMELAAFGAVLGRTLVAVKRSRSRDLLGSRRSAAQLRAGLFGAALVLLRPEAAVLVFAFAVIVARGAGARSGLLAFLRGAGPGALATLGVLALNKAMTGEAQSAGALLKLLSQNPYLSDTDRARELVMNLLYAKWKVLETYLTCKRELWPLLPALGVVALFSRRTRGLAASCLFGAAAFTLLVSWNGAARYQNFRYYMPALLLVLVAAALGAAALDRGRTGRILGATWIGLGIALAWPGIGAEAEHFRRASKNIHDQQVEVGRRLALTTPESAIVLVNDAGAIPYFSGRHAIDALGLGGYRGLPLAAAAANGEAATIEILERLPEAERPGYLALYPNWFASTTSRFGTEIDRVSIDDNVICGGTTKGIYRADWSALADSDRADAYDDVDGAFDVLDVADVISERQHSYVSPAPLGGWTVLDIHASARHGRRFDAGRIIPEGRSESFVVATTRAKGPVVFVMRTDAHAERIALTVERMADGATRDVDLTLEPLSAGHWRRATAVLAEGVSRGDRMTLTASGGEYRDYHIALAEPRETPR